MGACELAHTTQPIGTSWLLGIGYWQHLTISPYASTVICYEASEQTNSSEARMQQYVGGINKICRIDRTKL
jgi:hypothetical protein